MINIIGDWNSARIIDELASDLPVSPEMQMVHSRDILEPAITDSYSFAAGDTQPAEPGVFGE